ncbi:3676_t:CDS:2 [Entrophospora sp. SA101]|nr:3676_t:CDS:2 [Entrophospora sp. SA101]
MTLKASTMPSLISAVEADIKEGDDDLPAEPEDNDTKDHNDEGGDASDSGNQEMFDELAADISYNRRTSR